MIYLLLGTDFLSKDQKITEIKKKVLKSADTLLFDYESLDARKLDPADLKKALISLPAIAKKRLIVIRNVDKLINHNKDLILELIAGDPDHLDVILDSEQTDLDNAFLKKISQSAKVEHFFKEIPQNVFDVTNALQGQRPAEALKVLHGLTTSGTHPLQIMGGLVWFWGNCRNRVSSEKFEKGLRVLQEADLNIKRSRFQPEYAVETAVAKLSSLIAC